MANENMDYSGAEAQLRAWAQQYGLAYDPSDLDDVKRHTQYDTGGISLGEALDNARRKYEQRAAPTSSRAVDSQSAAGDALYGSGSRNPGNLPGAAGTADAPVPVVPVATAAAVGPGGLGAEYGPGPHGPIGIRSTPGGYAVPGGNDNAFGAGGGFFGFDTTTLLIVGAVAVAAYFLVFKGKR